MWTSAPKVLIELAKPRQIAGGQLHPRRGMTAGPEEEIALLMRRWEQVKTGDGAVVLIGGEPGNREIAPRAAAHRVAEARRIVAERVLELGLVPCRLKSGSTTPFLYSLEAGSNLAAVQTSHGRRPSLSHCRLEARHHALQ